MKTFEQWLSETHTRLLTEDDDYDYEYEDFHNSDSFWHEDLTTWVESMPQRELVSWANQYAEDQTLNLVADISSVWRDNYSLQQ